MVNIKTTTKRENWHKRLHDRIKEKKNCTLKLSWPDTGANETFFVETLDHSKGGLSVIYANEKIAIGNNFWVDIDPLNILNKGAEVIWLKKINGDCVAGLQWLDLYKQ